LGFCFVPKKIREKADWGSPAKLFVDTPKKTKKRAYRQAGVNFSNWNQAGQPKLVVTSSGGGGVGGGGVPGTYNGGKLVSGWGGGPGLQIT